MRHLFENPTTPSAPHQASPRPPYKRAYKPSAQRSRSVSPVDNSLVLSLSTTTLLGGKSGRSSHEVSPIDDDDNPLNEYFQVYEQHHSDITAPSTVENPRESSSLLVQQRDRHVFSPHDIHGTGSSSKINHPCRTVRGAFETRFVPMLIVNALQPRTTLAHQHDDQDDDHNATWTPTINRSAPTRLVVGKHQSQGTTPSCPNKELFQVGSDEHRLCIASHKPVYDYTIQPGRVHLNGKLGFHSKITTAETDRGPRSNTPEAPKQSQSGSYSDGSLLLRRKPIVQESTNYHSSFKPIDSKEKLTSHSLARVNDATWHYSGTGEQLPSRFSDTTCSTTTYESTPSIPELNIERRTPTPASSILSRKRPVDVTGTNSPNATTRKPTPSDMKRAMSVNADNQGTYKPLPKSPPEAQAVTRVASLEAKLESLRCRRKNLQTVIQELTGVAQRSPIAYDIAYRQKMKNTIDGLSEELSEIGKEEHETGLQLHRAWKRHEQNGAYESSSLWVKRLAS